MKHLLTGFLTMLCLSAYGQTNDSVEVDTMKSANLGNVTITSRRSGTRRMGGPVDAMRITRDELFKAACCNLGESFTTNPSVDVNYSDAATGAKQIKLLGLSGTYVQMLTENLPNFRGAAAPYALDYVPGPWMKSIQVSKGSASVRNGYESITGQIDVEYLKPEDEQGVTVNLFGNTMGRMEANADANIHLSGSDLSTEILAHYQDDTGHHDQNDDGFMDQPNVRQWNLQNRWYAKAGGYLFHGGIALVKEKRDGGQRHAHEETAAPPYNIYKIGIETDRYEGYMKHAFLLDPDHGTNVAVMGNVALHKTDAAYGQKLFNVDETNAYAQLMVETNVNEQHNLSAGLSLNYDSQDWDLTLANARPTSNKTTETTPGAYVQYTYNLNDKLTAMAGIRADHSSQYGTFVTPRFHLKLAPSEVVSFRLSAGKGYRTVHALAENNNLLASGRTLVIDDDLEQERAWNYGVSSSLYIPLLGKTLKVNAEYYHTRFSQQAVIDYDSNPGEIHIANLSGKSYSNTVQVDATYPVVSGLELTAAWRLNDVKCTYGGQLMKKPLTSRYKGLLTASYKTPLGLWQVDATLQLNGGGRLPAYYEPTASTTAHSHDAAPAADGAAPAPVDGTANKLQTSNVTLQASQPYHAYEQVSAQVTRWFRHFSVYVGGENLTGFRQKKTIINAANPWSTTFDPTLVWGPVQGTMFYAGVRINFGRL